MWYVWYFNRFLKHAPRKELKYLATYAPVCIETFYICIFFNFFSFILWVQNFKFAMFFLLFCFFKIIFFFSSHHLHTYIHTYIDAQVFGAHFMK